jgi:hypothetical protein
MANAVKNNAARSLNGDSSLLVLTEVNQSTVAARKSTNWGVKENVVLAKPIAINYGFDGERVSVYGQM